ncbi:MAG TPA: flagellin [Alphaproteobacteria bacterium]|nr:flagellin [Alphaproteobacteria bacterium]
MIARISTFLQNQDSLRSMQTATAGLALSTYQITSGDKARQLADVSNDANQILSLTDVQARAKVYSNNITGAQNQLKSAESVLTNLLSLLEDATSSATLGRNENDAATRASLAPKLESLTQSFYSALQTQFNGRYIFSGQNGLTSPIAGSGTATAYNDAQPSTAWYMGDNDLPGTVTGPGTSLNFGVLGNDPAFQDMKAGLEAIWYGLQNNSTTDMDSGIALLKNARSGVSSLLGEVGGQLSSLSLVSDNNDAQSQFIQTQLDGLQKVDVSDAMTKFSQQAATLQASMAIITQVNRLSLLDFLR